MYDNEMERKLREIIFEPRIKLNHKIEMCGVL